MFIHSVGDVFLQTGIAMVIMGNVTMAAIAVGLVNIFVILPVARMSQTSGIVWNPRFFMPEDVDKLREQSDHLVILQIVGVGCITVGYIILRVQICCKEAAAAAASRAAE